MSNQHGDFIWYELMTSDPDAATTFYAAVTGWKAQDFPGNDGYRIFMADESAVSGLLRTPEEAASMGARPAWFGYIGVDDVDSMAKTIVDAGGKQFVPPTDIPEVGRFAMMADPQGAPFYVMRGLSDEPATSFAPDKAGHCQWNELATTDATTSLAFYSDRFGWRKGDVMPMGDLGDYQFIEHGGAPIGAVMRTAEGRPPFWIYYFGVEDIEAAAAAIRSGGGEIHHGPADVPGGSVILVASDPQGAMFGLVAPAAA